MPLKWGGLPLNVLNLPLPTSGPRLPTSAVCLPSVCRLVCLKRPFHRRQPYVESERGKPSSHVSMSQCLMSGSMSSRARPLRPRRSSRQGFRGRTSLGETHPNVLSPVARLKIRIPASRRPRSHPKWLNARLKADLLARICVRGKVRKAAQPKLCGRTAMRCRVRACGCGHLSAAARGRPRIAIC